MLFFYCGGTLSSAVYGTKTYSEVRASNNLLGWSITVSNRFEGILCGTDNSSSVLLSTGMQGREPQQYSAYGYASIAHGELPMPHYNGQCPDLSFGGYLLGNGRRVYSTEAMRFGSPDPLSPFGPGFINYYAYCGADPINFSDPSGHIRSLNRMPQFRLSTTAHAREGLMAPSAQSSPGTDMTSLVNHLEHSPPSNLAMPALLVGNTLENVTSYLDHTSVQALHSTSATLHTRTSLHSAINLRTFIKAPSPKASNGISTSDIKAFTAALYQHSLARTVLNKVQSQKIKLSIKGIFYGFDQMARTSMRVSSPTVEEQDLTGLTRLFRQT